MNLKINNFNLFVDERKEKLLFHINNVQFKAGCLNIISGESGTGKTSFFNAISNNSNNYTGDIIFDKKNVNDQIKFSYLSADLCFIPEITIIDFLHLVSSDDVKIDELLTKLSLIKIKHQKIYKCSRGEQVRIEICAFLLKDSDLYLFDEPTANLDVENKKIIFDVLGEFAKSHLVIVSTHDSNFISIPTFSMWEIINNQFIVKKESLKSAITNIKSEVQTKESKFPLFKFSFIKASQHKFYFILSIIFCSIFLISSFISSSFLLIDDKKTLYDSINTLQYNYNMLNGNEDSYSFNMDNNAFYTTEMKILNNSMKHMNVVCLEDLDDETKNLCTEYFDNFKLDEKYNAQSQYYHPIVITTEINNYLKENKVFLNVGDIFPCSLIHCSSAVNHVKKEDKFIIAGIIDYGTDFDNSNNNLSS